MRHEMAVLLPSKDIGVAKGPKDRDKPLRCTRSVYMQVGCLAEFSTTDSCSMASPSASNRKTDLREDGSVCL